METLRTCAFTPSNGKALRPSEGDGRPERLGQTQLAGFPYTPISVESTSSHPLKLPGQVPWRSATWVLSIV
ncbi:hypothetical protein KRM28CT15_22330 [Krasilnikovia sp. M28-CT-15]